jgi:hypothetical protein
VAENLETRPWRHDDLDTLRASAPLFASDTYSRQFLAGGRRLRPLHLKVVEQLATPERYWTGHVAVHGDQLIALAECSWSSADSDSPVLAVNVAGAWQESGIGLRVLGELVGRCVHLGLTRFNVDYVASNVPMRSLMDAIASRTGARYTTSGTTRAGLGHVTVRAA